MEVVTVAGELSDQKQVDAMVDEALRQAGQIDIVYNNAAIMTPTGRMCGKFPRRISGKVSR